MLSTSAKMGLVAAAIMQGGNTALPEDTVIETPVITPSVVVLDVDGNPIPDVEFRSLVLAATMAPDNTTLKLVADQTVYASMEFKNLNNITIDGDGKTITFMNDGKGIEFTNANATLNNFKVVHNGSDVAITASGASNIVLTGDETVVEAAKTAIKLTDANSTLEIAGGTYTAREAEDQTDAVIFSSMAHVSISGGNFNVAEGGAHVYIDETAPTKLTTNITGGNFTTTPAPVEDEEETPETAVPTGPVFVNKSYVAIMVIAPEILAAGNVTVINNGFGTPLYDPRYRVIKQPTDP